MVDMHFGHGVKGSTEVNSHHYEVVSSTSLSGSVAII